MCARSVCKPLTSTLTVAPSDNCTVTSVSERSTACVSNSCSIALLGVRVTSCVNAHPPTSGAKTATMKPAHTRARILATFAEIERPMFGLSRPFRAIMSDIMTSTERKVKSLIMNLGPSPSNSRILSPGVRTVSSRRRVFCPRSILRPLTRIIHGGSAASAGTRLRRAVSPFSPSTYCTSMPQDFTTPDARLASRLHAFATNLHE